MERKRFEHHSITPPVFACFYFCLYWNVIGLFRSLCFVSDKKHSSFLILWFFPSGGIWKCCSAFAASSGFMRRVRSAYRSPWCLEIGLYCTELQWKNSHLALIFCPSFSMDFSSFLSNQWTSLKSIGFISLNVIKVILSWLWGIFRHNLEVEHLKPAWNHCNARSYAPYWFYKMATTVTLNYSKYSEKILNVWIIIIIIMI